MSSKTPVPTGAGLRALRESYGMTQIEMAEWVGVNRQAIRRWENGEFPVTEVAAKRLVDLVRGAEKARAELLGTSRKGVVFVPKVGEGMGKIPGSAIRAVAARLSIEQGVQIAYEPGGRP
jgi:predicted transcriptional regulator